MKRMVCHKKSKTPQEKLFCNYVHRICMQTRLDGYDYCIRHILEDRSAPFRQCSYVHPQNRKRCANAAPKNEKRDSLCPWHSKRALLGLKAAPVRKAHVENVNLILSRLEDYCVDPNHNHWRDPNENQKEYYDSLPVSGGKESDLQFLGSTHNSKCKTRVGQAWLGSSDESETENDSELDDPLKHAGVYTYEEATRILKDKLIRLQALYIEQFRRLQHVLREKRRNYLHELKVEKKTMGSIHDTPRSSAEEETQYECLKALNRYHRRSGREAVLQWKALRKRRALTEGSNFQLPQHQTCTFTENGQKCDKRVLALSKFCLEHILSDRQQVLYKRCSGGQGDCRRPVLPYTENNTCILHVSLPKTEKEEEEQESKTSILTNEDEDISQEPEHFQSMDDIASLGLDAVVPGSLFGLNQFGEPGESTDSALSGDRNDLMQIQPITLNSDI